MIIAITLTLFPIFYYSAGNIDYLNLKQLFEYIVILQIPSLLFIAASYLLVKNYGLKKETPILIAAFIFCYLMLPSFHYILKLRIEDSFYYQLFFVLAVIVIISTVNKLMPKLLLTISLAAMFTSLGNLVYTYFNKYIEIQNFSHKVKTPSFFPQILHKKPDIYFLVYDAYVGEKLLKHYGIENTNIFSSLEESNFKLYHNKLSTRRVSLSSIADTFTISTNKKNYRKVVSGFNPVYKFLDNQGYKINLFASDHFFRGYIDKSPYQIVTPTKSLQNILLEGNLAGEFKFDSIYKNYNFDLWLKQRRELFSKDDDQPRFIYSHFPFPGHSQNSGKCRSNEIKLWEEKLKRTNIEILKDIQAIQDSKKEHIIIIAGDHGPYLTGDCVNMKNAKKDEVSEIHMLDRKGIFMAIKWLGKEQNDFESFTILQNVFLHVFGYLNDDKELLENTLKRPISWKNIKANSDGILETGKCKNKYIYDCI